MTNAVGVVCRAALTILKLAALTQAAEHVGNDKAGIDSATRVWCEV
jgi:hypothetical protein